jgi:23S rRNA (uridine2552-2'-O)-methyltransferase
VAVARVNALGERKARAVGRVLGVDFQDLEAIPGADLMTLDFLETGADAAVRDRLGGRADVVLSDMAAPASGHPQTDNLRITALAEAAADFAMDVLEPGGAFVAKVLGGGADPALVKHLHRAFAKVQHVKPSASRKDSSEKYLVATGFRARSGD